MSSDHGEIRYDEFDRYVVLAGAGRTMHRARVERDGSWGTTICGLCRQFATSYTIDEAPRLPWVCCTLCVRRLDRAGEERVRHSDGGRVMIKHHAHIAFVVICDACDLWVEVETIADGRAKAEEHEAGHSDGPTDG